MAPPNSVSTVSAKMRIAAILRIVRQDRSVGTTNVLLVLSIPNAPPDKSVSLEPVFKETARLLWIVWEDKSANPTNVPPVPTTKNALLDNFV